MIHDPIASACMTNACVIYLPPRAVASFKERHAVNTALRSARGAERQQTANDLQPSSVPPGKNKNNKNWYEYMYCAVHLDARYASYSETVSTSSGVTCADVIAAFTFSLGHTTDNKQTNKTRRGEGRGHKTEGSPKRDRCHHRKHRRQKQRGVEDIFVKNRGRKVSVYGRYIVSPPNQKIKITNVCTKYKNTTT